MSNVRSAQLRVEYSLLKLAVRAAAEFRIPARSLTELVRLAYFEVLRHEGLTQVEIGRRLGQSARHMRSLAQRLRSDFFSAEREGGLIREIENAIAEAHRTEDELAARLPAWSLAELRDGLHELLQQGRISGPIDGRYRVAPKYVLLGSEQFHHRIDALNHFVEGAYRAVMRRIVYDDKQNAMVKMITFSANPDQLAETIRRIEADLRREIAKLEEQAELDGTTAQRFMLGMTLAPVVDPPSEEHAGDSTRSSKIASDTAPPAIE